MQTDLGKIPTERSMYVTGLPSGAGQDGGWRSWNTSRQRAIFQLQAKAACGSGLVYKVSKLTDKRAANLRGWMGCLSESLRAGGSAMQKMGMSLVTWSPPPQLCTLQTKWLPMSLWVGLAGDYCSASVSFDSVSFCPVWRLCSNLFSQPDSGDWGKHGCW